MDRNWSMESNTLIDPRGGGVSQWMTTTPVENSTPSKTLPMPDTPETSFSRRMVKRRIPDGARSAMSIPSPLQLSPVWRMPSGRAQAVDRGMEDVEDGADV